MRMEPFPSSLRKSSSGTKRYRFVQKVLAPAIARKSCPICLGRIDDRRASVLSPCRHAYCSPCIRKWSGFKRTCPLCNSNFRSWFSQIRLRSGEFLEERPPPLVGARKIDGQSRRTVLRRPRDDLSRRSRQLPWRRSFGRPGTVPPEVAAERALRWRASIYSQRLQAIPCSPANCLGANILKDKGVKERLLRRIEPWINRELRAILGDPDPSVIIHVITSLFIAYLEKKSGICSGSCGPDDESLSQLRPYLHEWTDMFWHELRCFAESPFRIGTYDAVVEYRQLH